MGYDPLDDIEEMGTEKIEQVEDDDELLEEEFDSSEELSDDEDVFEAFE